MSRKFRRSSKKLPKYVTELFGGSWRYKQSDFDRGPEFPGYSQEAAYVNNVRDYTTADMKRIGNITTLWHGTHKHALPYIASGCLLPGSWGLFGGGIYTAPHYAKAMRHSGYQKKYLLKCRGAMGRPYVPYSAGDMSNLIDGVRFHSVHASRGVVIGGVWGGSLANDEVVFYNPNQVVVDVVYVYTINSKVQKKKPQTKHQRNAKKKEWKKRRAGPCRLAHPCKQGDVMCGNAYKKTTSQQDDDGYTVCKCACIVASQRRTADLDDPYTCPFFTDGTVKK